MKIRCGLGFDRNRNRKAGHGLAKKKVNKKKGTTTTRRRVPPILYLVKVFTFLSKFLPFSLKTFSYVFHFHNLSKIHSEKTIFAKKFLEKKQKKLFIFFFWFYFFSILFFFEFVFFEFIFFRFFFFSIFCFFRFFFSLSKTYSTPFSFYFIVIHLLPTKKKDRKNASLDQYIVIFRLNSLMFLSLFYAKIYENRPSFIQCFSCSLLSPNVLFRFFSLKNLKKVKRIMTWLQTFLNGLFHF